MTIHPTLYPNDNDWFKEKKKKHANLKKTQLLTGTVNAFLFTDRGMLEKNNTTQNSITTDLVKNCFKILNILKNIKESIKIPYPKQWVTTTDGHWLLILSPMHRHDWYMHCTWVYCLTHFVSVNWQYFQSFFKFFKQKC